MFIEINAAALSANGHSTAWVVNLLKSLGYTMFQIHPPHVGWDDPQFDVLVS
jgi:hypothetical protein